MLPGSDWAGGTPGDSRWAGDHQKYYINKLMFLRKRSTVWAGQTKFLGPVCSDKTSGTKICLLQCDIQGFIWVIPCQINTLLNKIKITGLQNGSYLIR